MKAWRVQFRYYAPVLVRARGVEEVLEQLKSTHFGLDQVLSVELTNMEVLGAEPNVPNQANADDSQAVVH